MQSKRCQSPIIKYLPNIITGLRLVGAVGMLFTKPFSLWFFALYTFCGISDLVDGWLARSTNTTSELGAKLDSIADLSFYAIMAIKIFPTLWKRLPMGIWIAVASIVALRVFSYLFVAFKQRKFASLHTYMNKLTGFAVFTIPFYINLSCSTLLATIGCTVSGLATVEELLIHLLRREPAKSIFERPNRQIEN